MRTPNRDVYKDSAGREDRDHGHSLRVLKQCTWPTELLDFFAIVDNVRVQGVRETFQSMCSRDSPGRRSPRGRR